MADSNIINGRLQTDFNSYVFEKFKKASSEGNSSLKNVLADDKIDKKEYESLKKEYTKNNGSESDFDNAFMQVFGITKDRLSSLKNSDNDPVQLKFEINKNVISVDSDDKNHKPLTMKTTVESSLNAEPGSRVVTGAFFNKVDTGKSIDNKGLDSEATLPQIKFDPKRYIEPDRKNLPQNIAYVGDPANKDYIPHELPISTPLDRPSFYVGGHASINPKDTPEMKDGKAECEVDCGLTWDRVYSNGRPTFTDKNDSGTDGGNSAKRYVCVPEMENGKPKVDQTTKKIIVKYVTCENPPKTVAGPDLESVKKFESGIQPNYAFRPFWRYDISTKLDPDSPKKDQEITVVENKQEKKYKIEQKGKEFIYKDSSGKEHKVESTITINQKTYILNAEKDEKNSQVLKEVNGKKCPVYSYTSNDGVKHTLIKNDLSDYYQIENKWNNPKVTDKDNVYFYPNQQTDIKLNTDDNGKITLSIGNDFKREFDVPGFEKGSIRSFKLVNSIDQMRAISDSAYKGNENLPVISTSTSVIGGSWKAQSLTAKGNTELLPNQYSVRGRDTLQEDFKVYENQDKSFRIDIDPNEKIHKILNDQQALLLKDKKIINELIKNNNSVKDVSARPNELYKDASKQAEAISKKIFDSVSKLYDPVPKIDSEQGKKILAGLNDKIAIMLVQLVREEKR